MTPARSSPHPHATARAPFLAAAAHPARLPPPGPLWGPEPALQDRTETFAETFADELLPVAVGLPQSQPPTIVLGRAGRCRGFCQSAIAEDCILAM